MRTKVYSKDAALNLLQKQVEVRIEEDESMEAHLQQKVDNNLSLQDEIASLKKQVISKEVKYILLEKEKEKEIAGLQKEFGKCLGSQKFFIDRLREVDKENEWFELRIEELQFCLKELSKKSSIEIKSLKKRLAFCAKANDKMEDVINTERQEMHALHIENRELVNEVENAQYRYEILLVSSSQPTDAMILDLVSQKRTLRQTYDKESAKLQTVMQGLQHVNNGLSTELAEQRRLFMDVS